MSEKRVEVLQVIRTKLTKRGSGVVPDPIREITQYWDMDGILLAEIDPYEESKKEEAGDD